MQNKMSKQIKKCVYCNQNNGQVVDISKSRMAGKMPLDRYFYTHCRIDSFRVLRQSFCGKFKIFCGFRIPRNPLFRMYDVKISVLYETPCFLPPATGRSPPCHALAFPSLFCRNCLETSFFSDIATKRATVSLLLLGFAWWNGWY